MKPEWEEEEEEEEKEEEEEEVSNQLKRYTSSMSQPASRPRHQRWV